MLPVSIDIPLRPELGVATGRSFLQKDGTGSLSREIRVCKRRGAGTAPLRFHSVDTRQVCGCMVIVFWVDNLTDV